MSAPARKRVRIGELLVANQVISRDQLERTLEAQKSGRERFGNTLISLGFIEELELQHFLARQLHVPFVELSKTTIEHHALARLPAKSAERLNAIIVAEEPDSYFVVTSDPSDLERVDEIQSHLDKPARLGIAVKADIVAAIDLHYRSDSQISALADELGEEVSDSFSAPLEGITSNEDSEATVARLLHTVFDDAVRRDASDIHLEPDRDVLRVRTRVDGVLREQIIRESRIQPALIRRLKIMASLDIAEKRLPQDGRFPLLVQGHHIDIRLSILPVHWGEAAVMRLLDQSKGSLCLEELGMPDPLYQGLESVLRSPHGLVLVTGPTGSGKTTTLYAALAQLNTPERKIITIEDPVEYQLPRVNQVQINTKIGLTFAAVLRSVLRQDPDIAMVGEMRDQETMEIALRGAMTGHLVLSTLHTNDAVSSALRMHDMGAPAYLSASALRCVLAQRLVRNICKHCKQVRELSHQEISWIKATADSNQHEQEYFRGTGCGRCSQSGYRGRSGAFELLVMDEPLSDALRTGEDQVFRDAVKQNALYQPLGVHALAMAARGRTTIEEAMRVSEMGVS